MLSFAGTHQLLAVALFAVATTATPITVEKTLSTRAFQISNLIVPFLEGKKDQICRTQVGTNGGSEGWFQVELEDYLKREMHLGSDSIREVRLYAKNKAEAADFVIEPSNSGPPKGLIIELKVQSSSQQGATLVKKVQEDQIKLGKKIKKKWASYDKTILAIAWDETADAKNSIKTKMAAADMKEHPLNIECDNDAGTGHKGKHKIFLFEWDNAGVGSKRPTPDTPSPDADKPSDPKAPKNDPPKKSQPKKDPPTKAGSSRGSKGKGKKSGQ